MLKEFADRQLSRAAGKNVLFCIIQSAAAPEGSINNPRDELQQARIRFQKNEQTVQKAFVYGDKRIYTRPFGTTFSEQIFYADSTVRGVDAVHLLVIASAMMEKQVQEEPDAENYLVIMLESPLKAYEIRRFLASRKKSPAFTIILMEKELSGDTFEQYVLENHGIAAAFNQVEKAAGCLEG